MSKGSTREGTKGAEVPPLSKSKLTKKDKISDSFDLFCVSVICELRDLANMVLKFDYDTVKLQSYLNASSNDVTKIFHFQAPPLAKSWLLPCPCLIQYILHFCAAVLSANLRFSNAATAALTLQI